MKKLFLVLVAAVGSCASGFAEDHAAHSRGGVGDGKSECGPRAVGASVIKKEYSGEWCRLGIWGCIRLNGIG